MATRFRLVSSGQPPRTPAFIAGWTQTTGGVRKWLARTLQNTAITSFPITKATATNPANILTAQFCSVGLAAQTVSGTCKGIIQAFQSTLMVANAQMSIRAFSADGATARGTILALDTAVSVASMFNGTKQNRKFPVAWAGAGAALSSLAISEGDILVVDIGYRAFTVSTTESATLRFGDDNTLSDLAENETDTTDGIPWIEFSQDLVFLDQAESPGNHRVFAALNTTLSRPSDDLGNHLGSALDAPLSRVSHRYGSSSDQNVFGSQGGGITSARPKYYKFKATAATPSGFVTWINSTGDPATSRDPAAVGVAILVESWDVT